MSMTNAGIEQAIHRSQHCQRNWDLSKSIPQEDLDLLITAATQCPSKQNIAFYNLHFITNRELIEKIYDHTEGFTISYEPMTAVKNPQVLANLLVVFEAAEVSPSEHDKVVRNDQLKEYLENPTPAGQTQFIMERDRQMAVGIAAGYLNLTASLMGYGTGCCACFTGKDVQEVLGLKRDVLLLMGIGFKNDSLGRRVDHRDRNFVFPTKVKQEIKTAFY